MKQKKTLENAGVSTKSCIFKGILNMETVGVEPMSKLQFLSCTNMNLISCQQFMSTFDQFYLDFGERSPEPPSRILTVILLPVRVMHLRKVA